ncbi:MAG: holo-ACP synthase [Candidatus Cloacimonadaceae bacterium]|jgi:holo-[acyl-carrier protein] synthase|nr:holo-ACP synthase [Candidatus Cloacimonadota bacterium]MDY0381432.1 holo-ACP synthase [Candidatus Cloacimonadaceae bacterium]MCB5277232.1 holo-ACP synthase [Candidatus Cloacimonadota bacterium]MCK9434841.1 holo-ACP synthase [Candidatus Cloacimonadota bacterium]MDD2719402.1 holo-ACP synthase [Candidatus Cloacimonadota bacterium]
MIVGIGTDIVEISRIDRLLEKNPRFVDKVYSPAEIDYCSTKASPAQSYAARFAAKEALMKALGTGWDQDVSWQDIEIVNDTKGKPAIRLCGKAKELAVHKGIMAIHLSLSHEKHYAVASVIAEG